MASPVDSPDGGRSSASRDFKWYARINVSKRKCHGWRKHLKSSGRAPIVAANFALPAVSFLCFVSFLSRERKEMKALKSLCAEREKGTAPQAHSAKRNPGAPQAHSAKRNPGAPQARHPAQRDNFAVSGTKKISRFRVRFFLSAASYPPGPPPAKYFRRL